MDSEIKIHGQLFALHQTVAFLLAREAVRSGGPFNDLHDALVNQVIANITKVSGNSGLAGQAEAEAVVSTAFDSLFAMAEVFRRAMPDK